MKDSFTVGEMASLFNLNVQTLHYYESIRLFTPVRKRETNGARIYQFDQVYALATIRFLKKLEYPLSRIKETMDSRDPDVSLRTMRQQSEELRIRCESLERIRRAIDRKIRFIEERTASLDVHSIRVLGFPERQYIPIGPEEHLYGNDDFYFYPTVVFYSPEGKRFGAMLTGEENALPHLPRTIPGGEFMVGYHRGPYERIEESFSRIRSEAAGLGLSLASDTVNINIIDQFVERDPGRYITEIQIRMVQSPL